MQNRILSTIVLSSLFFVASCKGGASKKNNTNNSKTKVEETKVSKTSGENSNASKGIGPIKSVTLEDKVDSSMAEEGKTVFKAKCSACHKVAKRFVGPALKGITKRRTPEWIMNMILNPEIMVKEDSTAKKLLAEYLSPMANQNLSEKEARVVLEYFRTLEQ